MYVNLYLHVCTVELSIIINKSSGHHKHIPRSTSMSDLELQNPELLPIHISLYLKVATSHFHISHLLNLVTTMTLNYIHIQALISFIFIVLCSILYKILYVRMNIKLAKIRM